MAGNTAPYCGVCVCVCACLRTPGIYHIRGDQMSPQGYKSYRMKFFENLKMQKVSCEG